MRQRQDYLPYIRLLADLLRLRDWDFAISNDSPSDQGSIASIYCVEGRKFATIRLSGDFLNDPPEKQRHTMAHELIHCHLATMDHVTAKLVKEHYDLIQLHHEYAVDGLADALAPMLPLPAWD